MYLFKVYLIGLFLLSTEAVSRTTLFCRIRQYSGLKTGIKMGFGIQEREIKYSPFQLSLTFRKITECGNNGMYLVVTATPVISPYVGKENKPREF